MRTGARRPLPRAIFGASCILLVLTQILFGLAEDARTATDWRVFFRVFEALQGVVSPSRSLGKDKAWQKHSQGYDFLTCLEHRS